MNIRFYAEKTPEARIAVVAHALMVKMGGYHNMPDYADFRDALAPYVKREILLAQMGEAELSTVYKRVVDILKEIETLDAMIREHPL